MVVPYLSTFSWYHHILKTRLETTLDFFFLLQRAGPKKAQEAIGMLPEGQATFLHIGVSVPPAQAVTPSTSVQPGFSCTVLQHFH